MNLRHCIRRAAEEATEAIRWRAVADCSQCFAPVLEVRGGWDNDNPKRLRASFRGNTSPDTQYFGTGLRCALERSASEGAGEEHVVLEVHVGHELVVELRQRGPQRTPRRAGIFGRRVVARQIAKLLELMPHRIVVSSHDLDGHADPRPEALRDGREEDAPLPHHVAVQLLLERGDEMDDGREPNRIAVAVHPAHLGGHPFEAGQLCVERLVIAIEEMADQLREGTRAPVEILGLVPLQRPLPRAHVPPAFRQEVIRRYGEQPEKLAKGVASELIGELMKKANGGRNQRQAAHA